VVCALTANIVLVPNANNNFSGTGAVASLIGAWAAVATTSGTTITFNATSDLGATTIRGGMLVDETAGGQNPNQSANWPALARAFANFETILSAYDNSARRVTNGVNPVIGCLHYEGGPQVSFSSNLNNGTNSTSDVVSLTALNTAIPGFGWNVSAYTLSGTSSSSEMTQMCLKMLQGWKLDINHTGAAANTGSYKTMIKTNYYSALVAASGRKGREVKPAQYGYQSNTWGLFPGPYQQGGQYTNYDAIQFNA
jgi:hypothetical protein